MSIRSPRTMTIAEQVQAFRTDPRNADLDLTDMRKSGSLELAIGSSQTSERPFSPPSGFPVQIERLEGRIEERRIPFHYGRTGFHYFLDGAQKTLPVSRAGLVPISVALSTAGILERDDVGQARLLTGSLREEKIWLLPTRSGIPELERWQEWLEDAGEQIRDPLLGCRDDHDYDQLLSHYGRLIELSQRMSGNLRALIEFDLLDYWGSEVSHRYPERWLVVDGMVRREIPRAIGLVKSFQVQHFAGDEAVALFSLPQGFRTTAFRELSDAVGHEDTDLQDRVPSERKPTMWYQRFWDASGLDARHGLVRVEAPHDVDTTEQIDELASWLMSERLPRATMDPRWPTLLYPIHFLEEILKRRLATMTAGWPS